MSRSFSSNLRGKVRNFDLPKNRPLIPLYEAIVNSINAIDERAERLGSYRGVISIEVLRERTLLSESDSNTVRGFIVKDNGIGFNETNMKSFMEADSDYKINIGGKGVGRFSWLKAFSSVRIESVYEDDSSFVTRSFDFVLDIPEIEDHLVITPDKKEYSTSVTLKDYKKDYVKDVPKHLETIASRIIQHCLAYFLRKDCPEIYIYDQEDKLSLNDMFRESFNTDDNTVTFTVGEQEFSLLNIKITDKSSTHRNKLFLCANERLVESRDLESIIINLDSSMYESEKYWYLGVLTGKYFDDNVDMNRLSFNILQDSSVLLPDSPGMDEIVKTTALKVREYLGDYLDKVQKQKQERIKKYTTDIAPQYRLLEIYVPDKIAALKPNLSDEQLDNALYDIKRDFENDTKSECNQLMVQLSKGVISTEEYQDKFSETIEKVSDVNRAALAEYVVHRRIILNLFKRGLEIKEDGKFNLEKYIHQLIYPMRKTSDDIPYENHNLWLIDEKLSFCQYISSDKPFDNSSQEDRTDLLFLDNPVVVAECGNMGTIYDSIVIFELKRPMRDDYTFDDNPIMQLQNYASKILSGDVKDSKHRPIKANQSTQFYLYAICDITESLDKILKIMNFKRTPDDLGAYFYNDEYHAYIEVISYDKIRNDSEKRNRVLFDKLGI